MCHLAQLYYNIDILRISNIPMSVVSLAIIVCSAKTDRCTKKRRPDGSTAMTQTVDLYARCTDKCNQDTQPNYNVPIYDSRYLQSKILQLAYVKRNKRVSHGMLYNFKVYKVLISIRYGMVYV